LTQATVEAATPCFPQWCPQQSSFVGLPWQGQGTPRPFCPRKPHSYIHPCPSPDLWAAFPHLSAPLKSHQKPSH
uniref:Uncharacterized protein n=1 Tax=Zosterops lateralis melanops TaxID=1220523 RepID=A0A8D2PBC1_ZOSLA